MEANRTAVAAGAKRVRPPPPTGDAPAPAPPTDAAGPLSRHRGPYRRHGTRAPARAVRPVCASAVRPPPPADALGPHVRDALPARPRVAGRARPRGPPGYRRPAAA